MFEIPSNFLSVFFVDCKISLPVPPFRVGEKNRRIHGHQEVDERSKSREPFLIRGSRLLTCERLLRLFLSDQPLFGHFPFTAALLALDEVVGDGACSEQR